MTGVSRTAKPPRRVERNEEHQVEGRDPGRGVVVAGRLGRPDVRADGGTGRRHRCRRSTRRAARCRSAACIGTRCWRSIARPARRSGNASRAKRSRTKASHQDNGTWASSSAITDGQHVFAYFESRGLYAYDMNGKLVWQADFGDKKMRNEFGEGSTPVLHGNTLVVVWDHLDQPFIRDRARQERPARNCGASIARRWTRWAHAAGRRARRPAQVIVTAMNTRPQLRPRDRQGRLGGPGHDDERDSVAGVRRRHGVHR